MKERFIIAGEGGAITRVAPPIIKGSMELVGQVAERTVALPVVRDIARVVGESAQWTKGKLIPEKWKDTLKGLTKIFIIF